MTGAKNKVLEMKTKDTEDQKEKTAEESKAASAKDSKDENFPSELHEPIWSVVSFEKVLHSSLNYDEAVQKMQELIEQKISGLCIITDEAAQNIAK